MKCIKCNQNKSESEFYESKINKSGRMGACIECYKKNVVRRAAIASEYINRIKSKPCSSCGGRYHPCIMDFHHTGDDKSYAVSKMKTYSMEKIKAEIAKCILLCANCHRMKHNLEGGFMT